MKKRSGSSAENVDAAPRHTQDNIVCRQGGADLLDKKIASSGQTAATEVESVDKDCSLDLNPNPSYPRGSDESLESDDSSENVFSSESSQVKNKKGETVIVNDWGKTKITLACDHTYFWYACDQCQQAKLCRWWRPPMRWQQRNICERCLSATYRKNETQFLLA